MEFPDLIKKERESRYKTPKEFHREANLPFSYYYYLQFESDHLPKIQDAITILKALKINLRKGLYAWVRDQMPDQATKAFFTEIGDLPPRSSEQSSTQRTLVVNRMQAKLLMSDPVYWELIIFLSSYYKFWNPNDKELAERFNLPVSKIRTLMHELYEYGMIEKRNDGRYVSKEWYLIPYEGEYQPIRDLNFSRAISQFNKRATNKFKTTITRPLTLSQRQEVEAKVEALTNEIVDMEDHAPPEAELYTIGVFASPRLFGKAQKTEKNAKGLRGSHK